MNLLFIQIFHLAWTGGFYLLLQNSCSSRFSPCVDGRFLFTSAKLLFIQIFHIAWTGGFYLLLQNSCSSRFFTLRGREVFIYLLCVIVHDCSCKSSVQRLRWFALCRTMSLYVVKKSNLRSRSSLFFGTAYLPPPHRYNYDFFFDVFFAPSETVVYNSNNRPFRIKRGDIIFIFFKKSDLIRESA